MSPFYATGYARRAVVAIGLLVLASVPAQADFVWQPTTGSASWNLNTNWSPATVPNAAGAAVVFSATNTANRTITTDSGATGFTVGAISFDVGTSAFTNSLTQGTTGSKLILSNNGSPVIVSAAGTGLGNNTISVPLSLTDTLRAIVDSQNVTSAAGALNLTAAMSGAGGFTKEGDGLATFGTGAKTYTGQTILSGGRTRMSVAASPTATSSFTIQSGGQLTLITVDGNYTFGSGPLNLNGAGPTTGQFSAFPGAIRNDSGLQVTINNAVVLQSNTTLHVQNAVVNGVTTLGSITLPGVVSGPGQLTLTAPNSDVNQGQLFLKGANTYSGGTRVSGGTLIVSGATATLGTGNVTVNNAASPNSPSSLTIQVGVANAIADTATLSIAGGGAANTADVNFVTLTAGVQETVGGLVLGGVPQLVPGTYGATGSGANFVNDEYFAGGGVVYLAPVPEPATTLLVAGGALAMVRAVRRRRGQ